MIGRDLTRFERILTDEGLWAIESFNGRFFGWIHGHWDEWENLTSRGITWVREHDCAKTYRTRGSAQRKLREVRCLTHEKCHLVQLNRQGVVRRFGETNEEVPMAYYVPPRWVSEDDNVWIPWVKEKDGVALRCRVVTAAGHHARVVNEKYGVDVWRTLSSLLVPPDDPRATR